MLALLLPAVVAAAAGVVGADPPGVEAEEALAVSIAPRSGRLGTEVTITLKEGQGAAGATFDARTRATWRGRYVPIVGEPSRVFEVRFNARQFRETGPRTGTVTLGEGDFKNAPNPLGIKGPGGLRGTLTLRLGDGTEIEAPLNLALEFGADWRWPDYPDGPRGIYPPELGGETEGLWPMTLSHAPEPTNPDPDRLMSASGHYAAVVQIDETPEALAEAPDIILADLVSYGPDDNELQRVVDVPLYRWDDDGDPKRITWCNDLTRPIVLVDTQLDQSKYPDVIVMHVVTGGSAGIAPTEGAQDPEALACVAATRKPSDWAPPQTLPEVVAQIEAEARGDHLYKAVDAARALASALPDGDYATWRRLRPLVESADVDGQLRTTIFSAFRGKQDHRIADEMLEMALEASAASLERRARMAAREDGAGEEMDWTPVFIVRVVFEGLQEPPLRELILSSAGALQLIEDVALGAAVHPPSSGQAVLALRDGPYTDEAKAQVALKIILARSRSDSSDPRLRGLLDSDAALPALRRALEGSGADYETLHWGAMATLVHLGDLESMALLRAKAQEAENVMVQAHVEYDIWRIEIQHPPEQLLKRIAATADEANRPLQRPWAVRRAVELGLPKEEIRQAILSYMADPQPVRWQDPRTGEWHTVPPLISGIKEAGLELGVLREGDLPEIRVSGPGIEPHP